METIIVDCSPFHTIAAFVFHPVEDVNGTVELHRISVDVENGSVL
jgi:hypothetical protein